MKCNVCERSGLSDLESLKTTWDDKQIRLYFCGLCSKRTDVFENATPREVMVGDVDPPPILANLFHQYLTLTKTKTIKRMGYDVFADQPCSICRCKGFEIAIETSVSGEQVLVRFCKECGVEPNIFLDYTPIQVFDSNNPMAALFLTPKFTRFLTQNPKNIAWRKFK